MKEFATYEAALELFRKVNCAEGENHIFLAYKDTTKEGMKYGMLGGVGAVGAALISSMADGTKNTFDGLLINPTPMGLGVIPLDNKGISMTANPSKMEADTSRFTFLDNNNIESIVLKNFNIFNSKVKKLKIKVRGGQTLHLMVRVSEKLLPYQEKNFAVFMKKYQK